VGVTGANIGVAETGSIVVETNEGNGRLVTSVPKVHVALIGLEKIVRRWEDAADLVRGHAISATGQRMTVYVSLISQRQPVAEDPAGREFHVILLDNGRTRTSRRTGSRPRSGSSWPPRRLRRSPVSRLPWRTACCGGDPCAS